MNRPETKIIRSHFWRRLWLTLLFITCSFSYRATICFSFQLPVTTHYSNDKTGAELPIRNVAKDRQGTIYFCGIDGREVFYSIGSGWRSVDMPERILCIASDNLGEIWVGTDAGVGRLIWSQGGSLEFESFKLEFTDSDNRAMISYCTFPWGVRFGNRDLLVDIQIGADKPVAKLARGLEREYCVGAYNEEHYWVSPDDPTRLRCSDGSIQNFAADDIQDRILGVVNTENGLVLHDGRRNRLRINQDGRWKNFSKYFSGREDSIAINFALEISNQRLGCATNSGFFCLDLNGKLLFHLHAKNGLPEDSILEFGEFDDGRIWLAQTDGFTVISSDPAQRNLPVGDSKGMISGFQLWNGGLLVSSDQGLERIELDCPTGEKTSLMEGVVHSFSIHGDNIYAATNFGLFRLDGDRNKKLISEGHHTATALLDQHLLGTNLSGATTLFDLNEDGESKLSFQIPFDVLELQFESDTRLWARGFGNRRAVIDFSSGWETQPRVLEVSSDVPIHQMKIIDGRFMAITDDGLFSVNLKNKKTELGIADEFSELNSLFGKKGLQNIVDLGGGDVALVTQFGIGVHKKVDGIFSGIPLRRILSKDRIFPYLAKYFRNTKKLWVPVKAGLACFDLSTSNLQPGINPIVRLRAETIEDPESNLPVIAAHGAIRFDFGLPIGVQSEKDIEYQCRLLGFQDDWSDWSEEPQKEFSRMPGGKYTFEVRARHSFDEF